MLRNQPDLVARCLHRAEGILKECCEEFEPVTFSKITFSRALSYWMQISCKPETQVYALRISSLFDMLDDPERQEVRLTASFIHELIHTIPGCWNHQQKFKSIAKNVTIHYPQYEVEPTTRIKEFSADMHQQMRRSKAKWEVHCNDCATTAYFIRTPKYVSRFNDMYCCVVCGKSNFNLKKLR